MLEGHTFFPHLFAGIQVAFEHEAHDGLAAFTKLPQDLMSDKALAGIIFLGVIVRTVDHDGAGDALIRDGGFGFGDVFFFIVGPAAAATQDDVAVGVAHGPNNRRLAIGIDADKVMWRPCGEHRIDCDLQAAFRAVLETDRHRNTAGQLAVRLTFRGARADRGPTDQIGDVLRADRIEQFSGAGESELVDMQENSSGEFEASGNVAGPVQMRIIDQAFPADRGSGFFKIGPHDNEKMLSQRIRDRLEFGGVLVGGLRIVNGAGADNDDEPISILPMKDPAD